MPRMHMLFAVCSVCVSTRTLPTAGSAAQSLLALASHGAFQLPISTVDQKLVRQLLRWLVEDSDRLPSYTVRNPNERDHRLLLPGDADGNVALAVASILRAITGGAVDHAAVLIELGAFIVSPGAGAQDLHQDRFEAGTLSCQLALHDTPEAAGGLELALGSWNSDLETSTGANGRCSYDADGDADDGNPDCQTVASPAKVVEAGSVVCYDGRLLHRGGAHLGAGPVRRTLYFTAGQGSQHIGTTWQAQWLGESALHPRLRCAPLVDAPLLPLHLLTANISMQGRSDNDLWVEKTCSGSHLGQG
jgi:hypothetical protein